ncbi:MAG: ribonuclease III [Bacteroidota bacterium]|nr:ribonuclease III [Bacteroidota bacterium]
MAFLPLVVNKKEKRIFKASLKKILGFKPSNLDLYVKAFIHKSATITDKNGKTLNNERFEFLGDAILDNVISNILYKKYPKFDEGLLTKTRSKLVNTNQLSIYSKKLNLQNFLVINNNNKLNKKHLYADSFEALIGAIFLDKGFKKTYKFIEKTIIGKLTNLEKILNTELNHKSRLLELSQKENFSVTFETFENEENTKQFIANILINNKLTSKGLGSNKKEAEQNAAYTIMKILLPDYNAN